MIKKISNHVNNDTDNDKDSYNTSNIESTIEYANVTAFLAAATPDMHGHSNDTFKQQKHLMTQGPPVGKYTNKFVSVCSFILIMEICERFAYYIFQTNLPIYIVRQLDIKQQTANMISGLFSTLVYVTPMIGAYVADVMLGRFRTIVLFSIFYVIGLYMISFSALPEINFGWLFFIGLFIFICVGAGGVKANAVTLGADQFNPADPKELSMMGSFFNWFYWMINFGTILANVLGNFALTGFGGLPIKYSYSFSFFIASGLFSLSLFIFILGKSRYIRKPVYENALSKFMSILYYASTQTNEGKMILIGSILPLLGIILDIILVITERTWNHGISRGIFIYIVFFCFLIGTLILIFYGRHVNWAKCAVKKFKQKDVDGACELLRMFPYLAFMVPFWVFHGVLHGVWAAQGCQMDTRMFGNTHVNPANVGVVLAITMCITIPLSDIYIYPFIGKLIGKGKIGPTSLQKIGAGYIVSILAIVMSMTIEIIRRSREYATTIDENGNIIPMISICDATSTRILSSDKRLSNNMSIWYQVIPYILLGIAEMLCSITGYDLFYNQVPKSMKSACQGLNLLANGVGAALNVVIQSLLKYHGFLTNDLNNGKQETYYLAVIAILVIYFILYIYVSSTFEYKDPAKDEMDDDEQRHSMLSLHERNTFARISTSN